jgi:spore coat polysaccharide biosynthesis protein SpsF
MQQIGWLEVGAATLRQIRRPTQMVRVWLIAGNPLEGGAMILGILQARASSRRLPGKVLKPILGRPMLERQIERLRRSKRMERLVVATSADASDDAIAALCQSLAVDCFRGSLEDVLDRFYQAARRAAPRAVVRLTGDCPLADPIVIDRLIELHTAGGHQYTSNTLTRSFPDGLDAEVVDFGCLESAWREARLPSEREHVTPFIYHHPKRFRLGNLAEPDDLSHLRWVVDEPEDLAFIAAIYEALYPDNPAFTTADILALLERRPDIAALMGHAPTNEGYQRSLAADAAVLAKGKT